MINSSLPFINKLKFNLKNNPQFIQVVLGPRQVGKTTSVIHFLKEEYKSNKYLYVTADDVFTPNYNWLLNSWQRARLEKKLLVIDEIQKIENWSSIIKKLIDEEKNRPSSISCVLLGSSSLKIQKGLSESLAGRFQIVPVYHWNYLETSKIIKMKFDDYLKYGGYPGSYHFIKNELDLINYIKYSIIEPVVEKDILSNNTVKSPSLFRQAFELLISYPAHEISFTKLLGNLQDKGNTDLIKYYLKLFDGAFLIKTLEKFSNKAIKTKSSSPKILPLCPAFSYLNIQREYSNEEKGYVFESLVGSQLIRLDAELFYWRERNFEVDFILKKGKKIYAIEIKSKFKKEHRGLEVFTNKYKEAKPVIINMDNYLIFEKDPLNFLENI